MLFQGHRVKRERSPRGSREEAQSPGHTVSVTALYDHISYMYHIKKKLKDVFHSRKEKGDIFYNPTAISCLWCFGV